MEVMTCKSRGWVFKCNEPTLPGEEVCFWHSNRTKTAEDIMIARSHGRTNFEGAVFVGADLRGCDFSGSEFYFSGLKLVEADFSNAHLEGTNFSRADLWRANFKGAFLNNAILFRCQLMEARFDKATLDNAILDQAFLRAANFGGAKMLQVSLMDAHFNNTVFEGCEWEKDYRNIFELNQEFQEAKEIYQNLKHAYVEQGDSVVAGKFFYREQECERKSSKVIRRLILTFQWLFWGYGEKPSRIVLLGIAIMLFFSCVYFLVGDLNPGSFVESLYFSLVSFTALGYGSWAATPGPLTKFVAVFETLVGISMIAFLVASLTRKFTRL